MDWIFKIQNIEVEEPTGWDAVVFKLVRPEMGGVFFDYSDNLTFVDRGASILTALYEASGVDADATLQVFRCGTLYNEYKFNFTNYVLQNNEVSINVEQTGFLQKFKNRMDLPVQLERSTAIDGETIDGDLTNSVTLHSKVIRKQNIWSYDTAFNEIELPAENLGTTGVPEKIGIFNMPFVNTSNELRKVKDINEYFQSYPFNTFPFDPLIQETEPIFLIEEKGTNLRIFGRLKLRITCDYGYITDLYQVRLDIQNGVTYNRNGIAGVENFNLFFSNQTSATGPFTSDIDVTFNYPLIYVLGSSIFINAAVQIQAPTSATQSTKIKIECLPDSIVTISQDTVEDPSTAKVSLIHEAFAKLVQIYTGNTNSFYSEYFGRTDLGYSANGCLSFKSVTNGLNIRAAIDENTAQLYPITTSFKDLFEASDAITPLGWGIEKVNGVERIRVEPLEYFYNQTAVLTLDNVANIRKTVALDTMYNEIEIGYAKWNLNNTIANGLDEFLSRRNFYVPISNIKKKLNKLCGYVASGYIIETTRRKQFEINPVSTFETDNDMFFICLKTNKTESETDGDFSGIVNVLFFDSLYNIRISPIRNLARWFKYLNSLLFKKPFPEIQFNSGEGNYLMRSRDITSCINLPNLTDENQNLNESFVVNNSRIFAPEKFEFEYPLSFAEFENIKNNAIFALEFSCSNTEYKKGFIEAIEYKPNSPDGGIATFKVLSAPNGN